MNFVNKSTRLLLALCIVSGCNINTPTKKAGNKVDSILKEPSSHDDTGIPDFLNTFNLPELNLPITGNYYAADSKDTFDLDVVEGEFMSTFKLIPRHDKKNVLNIENVTEVHFYDEGDLNGDGVKEIGIIPGYNTSACRSYDVYTFRDGKWIMLFQVDSHLGDREKGIDYLRREGDSIRVLSANDGCCQCFGLDTSYIKIRKRK